MSMKIEWNNQTKEIIAYGFATISLIFGMGLTAWGFAVPPIGEVHTSIQFILGEMLTFSGAIIGISYHVKNEISKAKKQVQNEIKEKFNKKDDGNNKKDN